MFPKLITFFMVALILFSTISHAASRPEPAFREVDSQHEGVENEKAMEIDDSCEGIGEDECLMRRTLAAHIDYLYTQKQKH
ncbi:phytosulfokines-like [Punica granatum]|uniref:Phytosulfokine n=1 Tax=Punica granatum TaxID=22663 RepID=A0A6P8CDN7_PUNGR|nr:phytosulfokines-like [Punica granatum]